MKICAIDGREIIDSELANNKLANNKPGCTREDAHAPD